MTSHVEDLQQHLQWAIELEHATLPPYLTALYSIKDGTNQEAVEVIHSVFIEEMLHLTLAANILNAVGGSPQARLPGDHPVVPDLPRRTRTRRSRSPLAKFSKEALETFLQIERPGEHDGLPEDDNFETIGQFYEAIEEALQRLSARARRGRALLRRPRAAGDRRPLLRRQRPDHRRHRPRVGARARSRRSSSRARACSTRRSGTATATCSIPSARRSRTTSASTSSTSAAATQLGDTPQSGPTGEPFDGRLGRRPQHAPEPAHAPTTPTAARSARRWRSSTTPTRASSTCCTRRSTAARGCSRSRRALMYGLKDEAVKLMQLPSGDGETTVGPSFEYVPPAAAPPHRAAPSRRSSSITDGPYLVYGNVPLSRKKKIVSAQSDSIAWHEDRGDRDRGDLRALPLRAVELEAVLRRHARARRLRRHRDGRHAADDRADPDRPGSHRRRRRDGARGRRASSCKRDGYLCMHAAFCVGRLKRIPEMMEGADDSDVRARDHRHDRALPVGLVHVRARRRTARTSSPTTRSAIAVTEEEGELAGRAVGHRRHPGARAPTASRSRRATA